MSTVPTDPPQREPVRATREHSTPPTVLLHPASSQEGTRYSHHLPRPVRGCLFTYGIAGFKLTLSHIQGVWPVKIVLDHTGLHTHPILN
jgi:hypothetical protein